MKRILSCLSALLLLLYGGDAFAQDTTSVSIPVVTADSAGASVNVPINVANFNNVGAITLVIDYDPDVLTFNGLQNPVRPGFIATSPAQANGEVRVVWFDVTGGVNPINLDDGKLVDLNFTFEGGSSTLSFNEGLSQVADAQAQEIDVVYNDGLVALQVGEIEIGAVVAPGPGQTVQVPLNATDLEGVGSLSLIINYDPSVLTFTGLASDDSGLNLLAGSPEAGEVRVGGFSTTAVDLDSAFAVLEFTFRGGTTALTFDEASQVTDVNGNPLPVSLVGGFVQDSQPVILIPDIIVSAANVGQEIRVPVLVRDLENIGAVSLSIRFNNVVLLFQRAENVADEFGGNWAAGQPANGVVRFGAFSTEGVDVGDGRLVDLIFTYRGGSTALAFDEANSEVTDPDGLRYNVRYEDGSVGPTFPGTDDHEAILSGINEVGPDGESIRTAATGRIFVRRRGNRISLTGEFSGLEANYSASHIHIAPAGVNGPVIIPLNATLAANSRSGVYELANNVYDLTAVQLAALENGGLYVNVHSTPDHPGGEIRGQILHFPNDPPTASVITSPDSGAVVVAGGPTVAQAMDPDEVLLTIEATEATDPNGDRVIYIGQVALDPAFALLLTSHHLGTEPVFDDFTDLTVSDLAALFDELTGGEPGDIQLGDEVTLWARMVSSDGSEWTNGPAISITLRRGQITANEPGSELPETFQVQGNYPNPFNPSTTITFDLPQAAQVSIQVVDLLGRQVLVVPTQALAAGKARTVQVDASALSSGTYFYRVIARSADRTEVQTGKMMLVK
jgi:hypothetical protein